MPWTYAGETLSQPGVIAAIDNTGISTPANTNTRELVLVGSAGGGQPKTVLTFTDPATAQNVLQSGTGLTAVLRALNPSDDPTVSPGIVKFVRIDPATQSSYNVVNGATTVIQLESVGYGSYTDRITTQITAGSIQGLKANVTLDNTSLTQDNLYQAAFSVQYTGSQASGLVTVSNASGYIEGLAGPAGTETVQWTANFSTYTTIQQVINYINSQTGWTASLISANPNGPSANALDDASSQACKATAYTVTAILQAVINFYNGTNLVTATRPNSVGLLPSTMTAPAYLTGGTNGTPTNTDWSDAFLALQNEGLARIIVPLTDQSTIHAMGDSHCAYMSQPNIRKNRVQFAGGLAGETVSQVLTRAQNLNSRRTTLVWPGIQDVDPITFQLTTYAPYYVAAQAAAIFSSLPIVQALTRQSLKCKGLEGTLQSTLQSSDYDNLVNGGVCAIQFQQNSLGNAYRFVRSVTTWLQDTNLVNVEISCVANEDYVSIAVGDTVDALIGTPGTPVGVGRVMSAIDGTLRSLYEEGAVVGDKISDAYGNIVVKLNQGAVTSTYNATIPAPINFAGLTTKFSLYSTTKAA
ncbi:hypothetical protein LSG31_00380 [Fodinisporobacter ferrooxydans]|uniref:Tail sheath protein subtilisin-like domain-containing protein n=1 Tax=Fodinisporobacter ferrooxydans TaxID=2901836 RepID=A0ABY4CKC0_9BACL|nr:hypothetical protein LSG31_00380 [Alicyclobacillaceae bacterium MYW30-H2]